MAHGSRSMSLENLSEILYSIMFVTHTNSTSFSLLSYIILILLGWTRQNAISPPMK